MKLPLQISFRNMPRSSEIEGAVLERATLLDEFAQHIMGCRVVIDIPHRHHEHGNLYQVRIDLTVPGDEIAINREPGESAAHRDVKLAIRDAFGAAVRQLEDYVRLRRAAVKTHEPMPRARVERLFPQQDYGFLQTSDGREIYFHRNSVIDADFDRLLPGTEVAFVEEQGDKGPQATTVRLAGRHPGARPAEHAG